MLHDLILANFKANNFVHGCLLAMSYGVKLMKKEYPSWFQSSHTELINIANIDTDLLPCYYNILVVYDINAIIGMPHEEFAVSNIADKLHHFVIHVIIIIRGTFLAGFLPFISITHDLNILYFEVHSIIFRGIHCSQRPTTFEGIEASQQLLLVVK